MTEPHPSERARPEPDTGTQTGDRRRTERIDVRTPVRMRVVNGTLTGETSNLSSVGVLFYSREPLQVSIEVGEGANRRTFTGQLVRLQRVSESSHGFAVEFDEIE